MLETVPIMEYVWERTNRVLANEELLRGVSEGTDGMSGKRETAHAAFSGHRAKAAGWPTISTDGARCRLDMEADRLLCDDRRMLPWRRTAGRIQRDRRFEGWTATGQDTESHMRQRSRGNGSSGSI